MTTPRRHLKRLEQTARLVQDVALRRAGAADRQMNSIKQEIETLLSPPDSFSEAAADFHPECLPLWIAWKDAKVTQLQRSLASAVVERELAKTKAAQAIGRYSVLKRLSRKGS